ncbi:tetratricopeptide repeat protein [Qipengyuania marisflavi]|uniref:Tetratricopeptide repeat protein n=1 Tax=Qipengyuania marisflavi TaxID=2486356 RepID=A0A5S3P5J4_9SPHN|nr:tetratricopeptide repeat protein [Qipengyuania marisflavi]TMM48310.1 tetratricopeptide repeat protein [Qipengyuania marisflavi]
MIAAALALLMMQAGPNPADGAIQGLPDELRNRAPRAQPQTAAPARNSPLTDCLLLSRDDADAALDRAQAWRESANSNLELAQSAHCLGLALVALERFGEAQQIFSLASEEAPLEAPAYRARLAAMAGNAALAAGDADGAAGLFAGAVEHAKAADDSGLTAGLHIDRARALVALDRLDEAAAALAQARASDPANAQAWLLSATLSRRQERLGEAQQSIEYAATLAPTNPAIGLEAGVIAALAGREQDARRSFASVIDVAPDSDEARRAQVYLAQLQP